MQKKKFGFLFGAGAEIKYGFPTGGKFALDIFRKDPSNSKKVFKEKLQSITKEELYNNWLPENYKTKNVNVFGKAIFQNIMHDTIENSKDQIIENIKNFNKLAIKESGVMSTKYHVNIEKALNYFGIVLENCKLPKSISFISEFKEGNVIFESSYFCALLILYKRKILSKNKEKNYQTDLGKILLAILQLGIGAISEKLLNKLNHDIFDKRDDDFDFLDEIGDLFQLNYSETGLIGIEFLLENKKYDINKKEELILLFAKNILETLFSSVFDYKSIIDSYWRYLYSPRSDWAKFCKLSIFLLTVKEYFEELLNSKTTTEVEGYYHLLKYEIEKGDESSFTVSTIATTNYSTFIKKILSNQEIVFLNGSVDTVYDPYLNRVKKEEVGVKPNHLLVPLIFTQSGTKPMTSIEVSTQYVKTYESWKDSDAVIVVGYGFGVDDEHINGILRTLIDVDKKKILVVTLDGTYSNVEELGKKLKTTNCDRIKIINVNENGKIVIGNKHWIRAILEDN